MIFITGAELTFLHAPLRGGEHLVDSEGIRSLFDALVLHLLDVRQAVHGTAEVGLPRFRIGTIYAQLEFTCIRMETREMSKRKSSFFSCVFAGYDTPYKHCYYDTRLQLGCYYYLV